MPPTAATQSALIIEIPTAEPAVGDLRAHYDRSASWGVPAHITVLYPFLAPAALDTMVLSAVQDVVWSVPRFALALTRIGWFGDKVVYLTPDPPGPLHTLTAAISATFGILPYAGAHPDDVPHLTVAHDQPLTVLRQVATQVRRHLPIAATADHVTLITGRPEPGRTWQPHTTFPLGR